VYVNPQFVETKLRAVINYGGHLISMMGIGSATIWGNSPHISYLQVGNSARSREFPNNADHALLMSASNEETDIKIKIKF